MPIRFFFLLISFLSCQLSVFSQEDTTKTMTVEEMSRKRQNPVSGLKSIFLQDVILPFSDGNANSFSIQPVWPFRIGKNWKLSTYTIIPFQSIPPLTHGGASTSGFGNILFNGFFHPDAKTPLVWGVGPAIQFPTRTDAALGSNKVSLGPAGLLYYDSHKLSGGVVAQNFWSLGGTGVNKVNVFSAQYILYYNFPKGWYLQSNATVTANWLSEEAKNIWTIPVGGGPGKTFQIGKGASFYSAALQGFHNVARPEYVGEWMIIAQFQIIFSM